MHMGVDAMIDLLAADGESGEEQCSPYIYGIRVRFGVCVRECVVCFAVSLRSRYVQHSQLWHVVAYVVGARRDDIESKALFGVVGGLWAVRCEWRAWWGGP